MITKRRAELAAFTQAGAGPFGVGLDYGRAYPEQGRDDEGRGAQLARQRKCLVRQRHPTRGLAGEYVAGHGHAELDRGVREVATGPRDASDLFSEAGGVGEGAGNNGDVLAGGVDGLLGQPRTIPSARSADMSSSASRANPLLSSRSSATVRPSLADIGVRLPHQVRHRGSKIIKSVRARYRRDTA